MWLYEEWSHPFPPYFILCWRNNSETDLTSILMGTPEAPQADDKAGPHFGKQLHNKEFGSSSGEETH